MAVINNFKSVNLPKYYSIISKISSNSCRLNVKDNSLTYVRNFSRTLSNHNFRPSRVGKYSLSYKNFNVCFCTSKDITCWKCGVAVLSLFCDNCKTLQRLNKSKNYFELLHINYSYDLKLTDLAKNYRKLQALLHPDKFGNKSQDEKDVSEEYSSAVNMAYSTLTHPIKRGLYMLKLKGMDIEEGTIQLDSSFLMDIMQINEKIEEETDSNKISEYSKINKEQMNSLIQDLSAAFQTNNLEVAKEILTKLTYFNNIDSKIKVIKQNLGLSD